MIYLSTNVDSYLEGSPNVQVLTMAFFILNFLAATQDIAVDGWALTILHRYSILIYSIDKISGYCVTISFEKLGTMLATHQRAIALDKLPDISWATYFLWPLNLQIFVTSTCALFPNMRG